MFSRRTFNLAGGGLAAGLFAGKSAQAAGSTAAFEIVKTDDEWKKVLTSAQYNVLRKHGTEYAGSSPLDKVYAAGTYQCAGCELPVYLSETKFDSGTGWPSFFKPIDNAIGTSEDNSLFSSRTEVHCRRCGGHLGHVFKDGPAPTGLRYCMNGVAMKFVPKTA
jgi:peptide-methionine (R)-S-oxide reductase